MESEFTQQSEDNILIVKGRFKSNAMNLYGLFLLVFNNMKHLDTYHIIVSSYSDMYEYEPHISWEKYEEYIVDRKWKGNFNNSMTASLVDAFTALSQDNRSLQILYDHIYNYDYDQMDIILYDIINRIIHEKNLILETIIQEVTPQEFRKIRESKSDNGSEETGTEDQAEDHGDNSVILQVKPIVAPVKGKPIYELRIGDRIVVRIIPAANRENYYIDLYNLREEKNIKPIPAVVVDIKSATGKNNPVEIITEIMPGVYGHFTEEEKQVRLKIYDPKADESISAPDSPKKQSRPSAVSSVEGEPGSSRSIIIMMSLFIIILALFMLLIYISW